MNFLEPDSAKPLAGKQRLVADSAGLVWALYALASSLPWLLPLHAQPWAMFYNELMAGCLLLPVAAWALWSDRSTWAVEGLVTGFAVTALIPLLQASAGLFAVPSEAPLISFYIAGFALALLVARKAEAIAPLRLVDALFAGLAIAALVSAGLALYQWADLESLGLMASEIPPGARPSANLNQPNNLATLLVWGLVAVWWGHLRGRAKGWVATCAAAVLLVGVALTQSRTGWLEVALLGIAAIAGRRVLRTSQQLPVLLALAAWFVVVVLAVDPLRQILFHESALTLAKQMEVGRRPAIWKMAIEAIQLRPWFGYGWEQTVEAHVALADRYPLRTGVQEAHNILLDLMLWNGIPLALAMIGGLAWWFIRALHGPLTAERALLLLAIGAFGLHAMLELPHVYAYFLMPLAVMMGTLETLRPSRPIGRIPRSLVALGTVLFASLLYVTLNEYRQIEASLQAARLRAARIANAATLPEPHIRFLSSAQELLLASRIEPHRGMKPEELDALRRMFTRYPGGGLVLYADAAALNARPADARWALRVFCDLNLPRQCDAARAFWAAASATTPEIAAVSFPEPDTY